MKRSPATWSTAIAAAALLAIPATGWAQASPADPQQSVERPASTATTQQESGQEHLRQAKDALNEIPEASLTGTAKTRVEELKRHISALESSAAAAGQPSSSAGAQENTAPASWAQDVAAIDRIVTEMIGSGSGTPGAVGTTGTTAAAPGTGSATSSGAMLDETAQAKLREVRTHITAFAGAMGAKRTNNEETSASASASVPESSASTAPSSAAAQETSSASPETATPSTASPSQEPGASTASTPSAQGETSSAQPDPQAVKRHLTAARDSLSQLTQLPAAAQLTGESRTQVSQLISNFNQLITTNTAWRAEYAKVQANLDALLGNQRADESATTPAPGAGAVGTSGTVSLDPAIRAKLVEFRSHLMDFEKAAGGSASTSAPESQSTPGTTGTTSATPPPSAAAAGTSGATGTSGMSSSAERATGTSGTTTSSSATTDAAEPQSPAAQTPATTSQPSSATQSQSASPSQSQSAPGSEAMRHIAAIEAILNRGSSSAPPSSASTSAPTASTPTAGESTATGTTGRTATANSSSTLDRADIDQIRTHLNELRRVLTQESSK